MEMIREFESKEAFSSIDCLWGREKEKRFFTEARAFGWRHAFDQFRSSKEYLEEFSAALSFVPAKFLPVVCGMDKEGKIRPTLVGKMIQELDRQLFSRGFEAFWVLTSGAAKEAVLGAKPFNKTRTNQGGSLAQEKYDFHSGKPILDGDFLLISPGLNEGMIEEILKSLPLENDLRVKFKKSKSRPISMIEIIGVMPEEVFNWHWRERRCSLAQISAPEFKAVNDFENLFASHVWSQDTNTRYILVIPTTTAEGFIGVEMDFFSALRKEKIFFWQKNHEGRLIKRSLKTAFFPCFEAAFPFKDSPAEAFAHYCHFLREVTWDDHLRLIWGSSSFFTSLKIAQKVVYPLAENPALIIDNPQSLRHQINRLFEGMKKLLDGDPYLGLIYALSAGENPTLVPVYGTGLIDPKGFFPELYHFLHQNNRLNRLISIMETCDYGMAEMGWSTFVSFIYEQTGRDLRKVNDLLCPIFGSNQFFPTLVDTYVRKALSKFYPLPLRNPCTGVLANNEEI